MLLPNEMKTILTRFNNMRAINPDVNNNNELDGEVIQIAVNSVRNLTEQILKL